MNINNSNPFSSISKSIDVLGKTKNNSASFSDIQNSRSDTVETTHFAMKMWTEDTVAGGGTGTISYDLKYAENSTDENPILIATGWEDYGFGDEFTKTININDIDPRNLTALELMALNSHIYGKYPEGTLIRNSQFESLNTDSVVLDTGWGPTENMGLNDRFDYIASLESDLAHYKENSNFPELKITEEKISNSLDAFLKFEKEYKAHKEKGSNSTYNPADDIATSMVDQFSKSSQLKKGL